MRLRMMISLVLAALLAGAASACSAAALHHEVFAHESSRQDADPITGEWDVIFRVQDTKTPATFKLKLDGDKVTGTVYSEHTGAGTLRDGSWKDNKLSFTHRLCQARINRDHRHAERWHAGRRISHRRLCREMGSKAEINKASQT